eukprot:15860787-Heterocapsa_arctica.AAC.1
MSPAGPLWLDSRTSAVLDFVKVEAEMTDELENMENFTVIEEVPEEEPKEKGKKVKEKGKK